MPIRFECGHCGKTVTAPEAAAGRRGKCPGCGQVVEIPSPPEEEEDDGLIPLAPLDEEEERREQEIRRALYEQEQALLAEAGGPEGIPLEHRENVTAEDLHHLVVNYCLDMAEGKLERAPVHVEKLRKFGETGSRAVEDFLSGRADEPVLKNIPAPVLKAFLERLKGEVS